MKNFKGVYLAAYRAQHEKYNIDYEDLQTCRLFDITLKELEESRKKENEPREQPQEISKDK